MRMVVAAAAVFALLALAGLSAFLLRDRWSSGPKQKVPATFAAFPLQLEVEAQGDVLNVRWNPQSAPVTQAREGRLVILEGDRQPPRIIPLDLQQLTSGHVYYRSLAKRVQFQLEIVDNSGGISRESVLALSSNPVPAVTGFAPPQSGNGQSPARKVESIPISSANADALQLANTMEAPPNRQPAPRAFTAPPSSRDRAAQVPAITLDQPPAISTNTALPPAVVLPTVSNLPANNPPVPQVKDPPATTQIRVGSLRAADLIKKVTPVYPPKAMSEHIRGTVRFTATIGKDGTVQHLQLISGNRALVNAATDAVKQWLYRPTLLNGDPVEVITQIDVNFTLNP
jgi:TonB family protein